MDGRFALRALKSGLNIMEQHEWEVAKHFHTWL